MADGLETKRVALPVENIDRDGTFSGYASLFGKVDLGKDRVQRGAFARSLKERGVSGIRMLFQHDPAEPIGIWETIREDERGLFVKGRIVDQSSRGREVLELMRAGAVDGLSIGFRTHKSRMDKATGTRTILQADLWEISVVTFPMLPQARVSQVKSATAFEQALPTIRQFEHWLTRDAGLTRSQARTVIGKGFAHLARKHDAAGDPRPAMVDAIRRAANAMQSRNKHD